MTLHYALTIHKEIVLKSGLWEVAKSFYIQNFSKWQQLNTFYINFLPGNSSFVEQCPQLNTLY